MGFRQVPASSAPLFPNCKTGFRKVLPLVFLCPDGLSSSGLSSAPCFCGALDNGPVVRFASKCYHSINVKS